MKLSNNRRPDSLPNQLSNSNPTPVNENINQVISILPPRRGLFEGIVDSMRTCLSPLKPFTKNNDDDSVEQSSLLNEPDADLQGRLSGSDSASVDQSQNAASASPLNTQGSVLGSLTYSFSSGSFDQGDGFYHVPMRSDEPIERIFSDISNVSSGESVVDGFEDRIDDHASSRLTNFLMDTFTHQGANIGHDRIGVQRLTKNLVEKFDSNDQRATITALAAGILSLVFKALDKPEKINQAVNMTRAALDCAIDMCGFNLNTHAIEVNDGNTQPKNMKHVMMQYMQIAGGFDQIDHKNVQANIKKLTENLNRDYSQFISAQSSNISSVNSQQSIPVS